MIGFLRSGFIALIILIIVLVWTNPLHQLIFTGYYTIDTGAVEMLGLHHGLLWWFIIAYHYSLVVVISVILLRTACTASEFERSQALVILAAVVSVWIANAIYISGHSPVQNMDISPIAFSLVAGSMAWGFFRHNLLDILPVAKTEVFKGMDDAILVFDERNRIVDLNTSAEAIIKTDTSADNDKQTQKVFKKFPALKRIIENMRHSEVPIRVDGQKNIYDVRVSKLLGRNGNTIGRIMALQDITARKRAIEAILESEEKYKALIRNIPGMVYRAYPDWASEVISGCEKVSGYTATELNSKERNWLGIVHPDDTEQVFKEGSVLAAEPTESVQTYRIITKDGNIRWVEDRKISLFSEGGKFIGIDGIVFDITERKKIETQLRQAQKMEAIGLLAGGVAHDLNNVLSGIVSYPDLLLMDLEEDSPLRKSILAIQSSGQKAAEIVQDRLALARRGVENKSVLNLDDIISEYLKSPEYEKLTKYHSNVSVETNLDTKLMNIAGSPTQLRKMIMNLVSNAAEAQPSGGKITISTRNQYVDTPIKGYEEIKEGDFVVLEIEDTGLGIAPEDLSRIFEPFYTKKVMGRSGTGLGMAVVWGTAHDNNGYLDLKSTEGVGTTFSLYFPITRGEKIRKKGLIPVEEYMGKKEKILVIDDIREQRDIAANILDKLNYTVTTVSSGEDAVEYMKNNSVDLLILDMIMEPGIDGLETYRRIINLHSTQKTIIASGYSETGRVKEAQKLGVGEYIKKPYTLEKIGIAVKEELEK